MSLLEALLEARLKHCFKTAEEKRREVLVQVDRQTTVTNARARTQPRSNDNHG